MLVNSVAGIASLGSPQAVMRPWPVYFRTGPRETPEKIAVCGIQCIFLDDNSSCGDIQRVACR